MITRTLRSLAVAAVLTAASFAANAQQVLKIAYIDPLSGAFADVGEGGLKQFQYLADQVNQKNLAGGVKFEVVGFDNKTSPQESLNVLKKVID